MQGVATHLPLHNAYVADFDNVDHPIDHLIAAGCAGTDNSVKQADMPLRQVPEC